jgi:hypothetical protein
MVHNQEEPGEYCFPPAAALITAAARLMLALLERTVEDSGGNYAFCDTDSMAIVATEQPGLVKCRNPRSVQKNDCESIKSLSWGQVDEIVQKFGQLNPYDRKIVPGSILKIERDNYSEKKPSRREQLWTYAISAKRYALFNKIERGRVIRKYSEHGLGHLINPSSGNPESDNWMKEAWNYLLDRSDKFSVKKPHWLDYPALSRLSITSQNVSRAFVRYNEGNSYSRQIKPGNFALSTHVSPFGHPAGVDSKKFHLLSPFSTDLANWRDFAWFDIHTGSRYEVTTSSCSLADFVRVKSYRDILLEYETHPEPKSSGSSGGECDRSDTGLLFRRYIRLTSCCYLGKEANRLEDVANGLIHDLDEVVQSHIDAEREWTEHLLPKLRGMSRFSASAILGISERSVASLRNRHTQPSERVRRILRSL